MMDGLFEGMNNRSERVATFLAILELTKSGRIWLNDDNTIITFNKSRKAADSTGLTDTEVSYQ